METVMMRLIVAAAMVLVLTEAALALSPAAQRGLVFVKTNCSGCHAIGAAGPSPLPIAPQFRTLHERYPVESLEESLAEGIVTGHPTMPQFKLDPGADRRRHQLSQVAGKAHPLNVRRGHRRFRTQANAAQQFGKTFGKLSP
jgi:cytochrome c